MKTEEKKITKNQTYQRIAVLEIEEVMPYIVEHLKEKFDKRVKIKDYLVKVSSLRLRTFAKTGIQCHCCGIKASFFAVERNQPKVPYHLNLWGYDKENNPILFTHDHILARSLGGKNNLSNTETMCGPCNWEKSIIEKKMKLYPESMDKWKIEMQKFKKEKQNQFNLESCDTIPNFPIKKLKM